MNKTKTVDYNGEKVEAIDFTPTWEQILPTMFMCYENFVEQLQKSKKPLSNVTQSMKDLKKEFENMAKAADKWNDYTQTELDLPKPVEKNKDDLIWLSIECKVPLSSARGGMNDYNQLKQKEMEEDGSFEEWMNGDGVVKVEGGYREQTTQYRRLFTTKLELYQFFKKEF